MRKKLAIAILAALFFSCGYVSNLTTKADGTPALTLPDLSSIATPDQADEAIFTAVKLYESYYTFVNRKTADKVGIDLYAAYVAGTVRGEQQSLSRWFEGRAQAGSPVPEEAQVALREHTEKMSVAMKIRTAMSVAFSASQWWREHGDRRPFDEEYKKVTVLEER